jgi:hypothetical protein
MARIVQDRSHDVDQVADFHLPPEASRAVDAAFKNLNVHGGKPGWSAREFAGHLTDWLIDEKLMPVHVAPEEFKRRIEPLAAKIIEGLPLAKGDGQSAGL